jgi:DNA helicase-2/ATP-dependent DNA helicase PcrA
MCLNSPDSLEEERRLCYVGITRAKEKLFISHCENRRLHGQFKNNVASRFLKEIPSEVLTYVREIKNNTNYNNTNEVDAIDDFYDSQVDYDPYDDSNNRYKKGMHVNHPTFGNGIITATEENGESMRLQIKFSKISQTKWILASFARLTII